MKFAAYDDISIYGIGGSGYYQQRLKR